MGFWIGEANQYYEGDPLPGAIEVPQRPTADYSWVNNYWAYTPTELDYVTAVQTLLDSTARQRGYDGILSACSYSNSTIPQFQAEGLACLAWRDVVWATCYGSLAAVQAGQMAPPTVDAFISSLPTLVWP